MAADTAQKRYSIGGMGNPTWGSGYPSGSTALTRAANLFLYAFAGGAPPANNYRRRAGAPMVRGVMRKVFREVVAKVWSR